MRSIIVLSLLACVAYTAKIAIFVFPLSNSQVIFTNQVAEELAVEHDVVIIRPNVNPKAAIVSKHPRVREIRTAGVSKKTYEEFMVHQYDFVWKNLAWYEMFAMSGAYRKMIEEACADFVNDPNFIDSLRSEKFDLAITHHCDSCPVSVIHAAGIPQYGYILSTPLIRMFLSHVGIPVLPATFPSHLIDASNEMSHGQRLKNFLLELMMTSVGGFFSALPIDKQFRARYGDSFPSNNELAREAKFLLANVNPDVEFPVPVTSKVTYFGGLGMSNATKPLQEPYLSFMDKAETVVFVSFGTVADPKEMPAEWKRAFVELFEMNPSISFIWRMTDDVVVPHNVLRSTWHPQKDLLGHPKVAAFITHAGYNSLSESIASGTPLITVPLFGDQFRNSRLAEYRGFAARVEKTNLTAAALHEALHTVLRDPSFGRSAAALRDIVFSAPVAAGDALRHAVNFALKHPGHNRDLPQLPLYQLYSIDMITIVFVLPMLLNLIVLWACCRCCCCRKTAARKEKTH